MKIGERIRLACDLLRIDAGELADIMGVDRAVVSSWMEGKASPTMSEAAHLADLLNVSSAFVYRDVFVDIGDAAYNGARCEVSGRLRLDVQDQVEQRMLLREMAGLSVPDLPIYEYCNRRDYTEFVEQTVRDVRLKWGLPSEGPLPNLIELLEANGVIVLVTDIEPEMPDAVTFPRVRTIVVRAGLSRNDARFAVAKEFAALIIPHVQADARIYGDFAAAFLVPRKSLVEDIGNYRRTVRVAEMAALAHKYGVPESYLASRALEVGIVSVNMHNRLQNTCGEESLFYPRLAARLYREGQLSSGRLAEFLGVDRLEVDSVVEEFLLE